MEFNNVELKLIKGCLLTTKETLKCIPFKNTSMKNTLTQIDNLLLKFPEGS